MSRNVNTPPRRLLPAALAGAILAAFVLVVAIAFRSAPETTGGTEPVPHFVPTAQTVATSRVLAIFPKSSLAQESPTPTELAATLVEGTIPDGATTAVVRTDTNCAPDDRGVSHCYNELDFGTSTVVVQHHHAMAEVPCLTPGETVRVQPQA